MSEPIVTNLAKIWNDENGIVHILFFQRNEFTEGDADEYIKSCLKISGGKPALVLIDFSNVNYLFTGTYKKLLSPELTAITKASAVVVGPSSNFVVSGISFLMNLKKEPFPIKIFTNEKDARDWLLTMKDKGKTSP